MMGKSTIMLSLLLSIGCNSCSNSNEEMVFPEGLQIVSLNDSIPFDPEWYNSEYKIVTYLRGAFPLTSNWADPIEEFPEIAFLFYVKAKDSTFLKKQLEEFRYFGPVIHDPEDRFFESNRLDKLDTPHNFIILAVKDNIIVDIPGKQDNPSFPEHFRIYLQKFLDEN